MARNLGLDYDEVVILKETNVMRGGIMGLFDNELILTNKRIMCLKKGVLLGVTIKTQNYPLGRIKVFNKIPQVQHGKRSNGLDSLDVYLLDGEEHFIFMNKNERTISIWIDEIRKLFRNGTKAFQSALQGFTQAPQGYQQAPQVVQPAPQVVQRGPQVVQPAPQVICPSCGKKLDPSLRFCTECGIEIKKKLGIDQQIELLEKLKSLVDAGVISQEEFEKKKKEFF